MVCMTTGVGSPRTQPSTLTVAANRSFPYSATAAPVNSTEAAPAPVPMTDAAYLVCPSTVHTGSP